MAKVLMDVQSIVSYLCVSRLLKIEHLRPYRAVLAVRHQDEFIGF
jgi:hypothetical protein